MFSDRTSGSPLETGCPSSSVDLKEVAPWTETGSHPWEVPAFPLPAPSSPRLFPSAIRSHPHFLAHLFTVYVCFSTLGSVRTGLCGFSSLLGPRADNSVYPRSPLSRACSSDRGKEGTPFLLLCFLSTEQWPHPSRLCPLLLQGPSSISSWPARLADHGCCQS